MDWVSRWKAGCLALIGAVALTACAEDLVLDGEGPVGGDGAVDIDAGPGVDANLGPVTDGGRGSTGDTALPCDVQEVLHASCGGCHGSTPTWGAPMALVTWEDTQQAAMSDPERTVHELMKERLNDASNPMPPATHDEMTAEEKALLNAWLDAGAPAADDGEGCEPVPDAGVSDDGGVSTDPGVGPDELPCNPEYQFVAHDPDDRDLGYPVPTGGDGNFYTCFAYEAPFDDGEQGSAWAPIIDDARTIHHWILWESPNSYQDGSVFPCGALPDSSSTFLAGWAPGGRNFVMPDDVGLRLTPGSTLLLQVHYWNVQGIEDIRDRSGVALCTDSGRTHEAGVVAVGPMNLEIPPRTEGHVESYTCPGFLTDFLGDMTILASSPHMHGLGRRYTTEIIRNHGTGDETVELLTEVDPWRFDDQTSYPQDPPVTVNGGDGVRVTCTYDNDTSQTVTWGENTEDEMCFDFLLVYPYPSIFDSFGIPANCTDLAEEAICGSAYGSLVGCP